MHQSAPGITSMFLSVERSFLEKAEALFTVLKEMGNPFQGESADLLLIDMKNIAERALAELVGTHQQRGQEKFKPCMECTGHQRESTFSKPIENNMHMMAFFKPSC